MCDSVVFVTATLPLFFYSEIFRKFTPVLKAVWLETNFYKIAVTFDFLEVTSILSSSL